MLKSKRGFTLFELILVIAVIAFFAAIAPPTKGLYVTPRAKYSAFRTTAQRLVEQSQNLESLNQAVSEFNKSQTDEWKFYISKPSDVRGEIVLYTIGVDGINQHGGIKFDHANPDNIVGDFVWVIDETECDELRFQASNQSNHSAEETVPEEIRQRRHEETLNRFRNRRPASK
jgi:prepilin-type N-terminal cleavage/methylation domain-containing protein